MDFKPMPFYREDHPRLSETATLIEKPKSFEKMLEIARVLSEDFPFLRVDLYEINGKIFFSELTLYPGAGFIWLTPDEWNWKVGEMIDLSTLIEKRNRRE